MRFPKIYLEITNVCNLNCSFCRGTARDKAFLAPETFRRYAAEARKFTEYLYLHVMGEPLLHPELEDILDIAADLGFRICITTNGTLLPERLGALLCRAENIYKVSISLHAFEANTAARVGCDFETYVRRCADAASALGEKGTIVALRLWNNDNPDAIVPARNRENEAVLSILHERFPDEWMPNRRGSKIGAGVYLEWGDKFDWPTTDGSIPDHGPRAHCFAMKDHIAILADGRVIPCCIDCDGVMSLGSLEDKTLEAILEDTPATAFLGALSAHKLDYPLCRHCNFH